MPLDRSKQTEYEISFLVSQEEHAELVKDAVTSHEGEVTFAASLRNVELAYPIKKKRQARFGYVYASIDPAQVDSIIEKLNHEENVLRFLVVQPPIQVYPDKDRQRRERPQTQEQQPRTERKKTSPKQLTNEDLQEKLEEIMS